MNSIFIVRLSSNNSFTIIEWAFKNIDDAIKFRNHLDKDLSATDNPSSIRELNYIESYEELGLTAK